MQDLEIVSKALRNLYTQYEQWARDTRDPRSASKDNRLHWSTQAQAVCEAARAVEKATGWRFDWLPR